MKRYYPVFLDLERERVLVVGEGHLAEARAAGLRAAGAEVVVVPGAAYSAGRLEGVRLVVDCSGDDRLGERVFRDAEERGILVNVLDRPAWCRYIAPAVVDRHPLQIAVSTAGQSPYLAAALRRRLEALFSTEWGEFVSLVGRVRRDLRRRRVAPDEQEDTYRRLLRAPIRRLLAEGRREEAALQARAIGADAGRSRPGRVTLVGAGPGDPGLLTLAATEALADADLVLHDWLVSPGVLRFASPAAEVRCVGKQGGRESTRQEDINQALIEAAKMGRHVVRLKGGDPFIFGRAAEELQAVLDAGLPVVAIPGVSAAVAAPAMAGIPLTMRGLASSVAFVTATADGVSPTPGLRSLAAAADTLVVLMPLATLDTLVAELLPVLGASIPAAVVSRATLPDQRVVRAPLGRLAELVRAMDLRSPATLVVGEVVEAIAAGQSCPAQRGANRGARSEEPCLGSPA